MRVVVRYERCAGHGRCARACPEVFRLVGPKPVLRTATPDEGLRRKLAAAARACPTGAIELTE
jgi:ferredoxin